ncbi:MAG TPA: PAS domain-containing protein [Humisphaera sp.]
MSRPPTTLTGVERTFGTDEIIVSKTDLRGVITYANRVFARVSGYSEAEILGQPHCLVRHPAMPRAVFKLLWDTLGEGREVFAYVLNRCKNGDEYWVFAHVTPSYDAAGRVVGYHSSRRSPDRTALARIKPLYAELLEAERRAGTNPKQQLAASAPLLGRSLADVGMKYEQFVFTL